jgi:biotin carboxylase
MTGLDRSASHPRAVPWRVVMVGFGQALLTHLDDRLRPGTVVVVEDPNLIEKRSLHDEVKGLRCVAGVIPGRYHEDLAFIEAVESYLDGRAVDVVLPALEYGVPGAAALAARLGVPGASIAASECLTDKLRLREAAAAAGLRNPGWTEVFGPDDIDAFAQGGPVVLKPANRHASLGVQLLSPEDDVFAAWETTVAAQDDLLLPNRDLHCRYLAEHRICGHEYSVEALVQGGAIVFLNVTDKLTALGRHPVELGHVVPADLPEGLHGAFSDAMTRLTHAIGFDSGVLHAEWIFDGDGPVLIECAGRLPCDSIVDLIDAAYGFDLVRALMTILGGCVPPLPASARKASAIRFLRGSPGRVRTVEGVERARSEPGVVRASVSVAVGDEVSELRSSWDRIGEVVAIGANAAVAERRAEAALALVGVDTSAPASYPLRA